MYASTKYTNQNACKKEVNVMKQFDRMQFYEALTLVTEAKLRGLNNIGLIKIKLEADALTSGIYPAITFVTDTGRHHEYIGDDFYEGLEALRKLIAHAREEQQCGEKTKPAAARR